MAEMSPKQTRQAILLARQKEVRALVRRLVDVERRATKAALAEATGRSAAYFTKFLRPEGNEPPPEPEALSEADARTVERALGLEAFALSIDPPPAIAERQEPRYEREWLRSQLSPVCQVRLLVTGDLGSEEVRRLVTLLEAQRDWLGRRG